MKHESFNESVEMYLKTVSELAMQEEPVPISAVADRLGISCVSATEMIHRLQEHGLLNHQPYKGVHLTDAGQQKAAEVVRIHRLWECFLVDHLGLAWDRVHDLACRLEHATATEIADVLDAFLDHPRTCPHGNPIPSAAGDVMEVEERPLSTLQPGQTAVIARIHPETDALLRYLSELELVPGVHITLQEVAPFRGPLILSTQDGIHYLGQVVAQHIFVRLEDGTR
jgi:DtxR family Mn-dependent transcriptional regulator